MAGKYATSFYIDIFLIAGAGFSMAWSIISLLTYLTHDYKTMLVCRFFLGITEAPVSP